MRSPTSANELSRLTSSPSLSGMLTSENTTLFEVDGVKTITINSDGVDYPKLLKKTRIISSLSACLGCQRLVIIRQGKTVLDFNPFKESWLYEGVPPQVLASTCQDLLEEGSRPAPPSTRICPLRIKFRALVSEYLSPVLGFLTRSKD